MAGAVNAYATRSSRGGGGGVFGGDLAGAVADFRAGLDRAAAEARARGAEAEAARARLQREYLSMLGETVIEDVLMQNEVPGNIATDNPDIWFPLMITEQGQLAAARDYKAGRILAVAHDRVIGGAISLRSEGFLQRTVRWLANSKDEASIRITSGHCEWLPTRSDDWALPQDLTDWGYALSETAGRIDDTQLKGADVLIMDTAGRLQNRTELMAELEKVIRVMKKIDAEAPHAVLLVLDLPRPAGVHGLGDGVGQHRLGGARPAAGDRLDP